MDNKELSAAANFELVLDTLIDNLGLTAPIHVVTADTHDTFRSETFTGTCITYFNWTDNRWIAKSHEIIISKRVSQYHALYILAHELRHAWQGEQGIMLPTNVENHTIWNGNLEQKVDVIVAGYSAYYHQPWELDANLYANLITGSLRDIGIIK